MDGNIVKAVFEPGSTRASAAGLWQWDYGQILQIEGITGLPAAPEVQFEQAGIAKSGIGTTTDNVCTVPIPDVMLRRAEKITAYIFLHAGDADGEAEFEIMMMVRARAVPESFDGSREYDALVQATKKLDTATTRAGEIAAEATEAKEAAQASQTAAKASEDAAAKSASDAKASEEAAAASAETASTKASEASASAAAAETAAANAKASADAAAESKAAAEASKAAAETAASNAQKYAEQLPRITVNSDGSLTLKIAKEETE